MAAAARVVDERRGMPWVTFGISALPIRAWTRRRSGPA